MNLRLPGILAPLLAAIVWTSPAGAGRAPSRVSFSASILPVLHARCQGCHQPASAGGGLVLTGYAGFAKGGEHGAAFVAGKPDASPVLEYLSGKRTLMPKNGPALSSPEIAAFRSWIAAGAQDDTRIAADSIDAKHPPRYTAPPVITALAWSPDGRTLAVSGYRETLLWDPAAAAPSARLVGQAQKILTLAWSPDGKTLMAAGGTPALSGEIQFWDTAAAKLINAAHSTYDTVFGASWSPDSKLVAFGCTDNTVRAISAPAGDQVLRFDNHSDWVLATTFATDGKHLLSASRDQAIKLILLDGPTGSFIDDINTHTSAVRCLARSPKSDTVACCGDDAIPRLYKVYRTEARTMNQEDHNLIRAFDRMPSPATALAFSPDGATIAVGCETGRVKLYDAATGTSRGSLPAGSATIYVITYSPDGKRIATGGFDGMVRLFDASSSRLLRAFVPVPMTRAGGAVASAAR